MEVFLNVVFAVSVIAAMFSNFYGVPGNIIIAINSFIYGVLTGFEAFSFGFVLTLLLIVFVAEFLEYVLIVLTARKYGASKWGVTGSIIGGIAGAISGAFVTPVMGAIIGSVLGVFIGATVLEFFKSYRLRDAVLSGVGAFLGKLGGLSIKTCGAVTMVIMIGYQLF